MVGFNESEGNVIHSHGKTKSVRKVRGKIYENVGSCGYKRDFALDVSRLFFALKRGFSLSQKRSLGVGR